MLSNKFEQKKWSTNELEQLTLDFPDLETSKETMELKYGRKWDSIRMKAQSLGLKRQKVYGNNYSLPLSKLELKELYETGKTINELAQLCNCSSSNLYYILSTVNTEIRNPTEAKMFYSLNIDYFKFIDSEDKAYFFGLLMSDGYHHTERGEVCLTLSEIDVGILQQFNNHLNSDRPLLYLPERKAYRLIISNKIMSKHLAALGLNQAKSFNKLFPSTLALNLEPHFMRGYFDGNGSVSISSKIKANIYWALTSCDSFLYTYEHKLLTQCGLNKTKWDRHEQTNIYSLRYSGRENLYKIYNYLYKDASIWLERKHTKFLECLKQE